MKKCGLFLMLTFISGIIITSCMGDEGQKISVGQQPGVVIKTTDSTKIQVRERTIFSDNYRIPLDDGDCVILKYSIDFGLFASIDTAKVEILTIDTVSRSNLEISLMDTVKAAENEQILSSIQKRHAIIRDQLFLYMELSKIDTVYPVSLFDLSYNTNYTPEPEDGKVVYDLFLRSVKIKPTGSTPINPEKVNIRAFDISDLLRKRNSDTLFFRVNYAKSFNKNSTEITHWSSADFKYPTDEIKSVDN